MRSDILLVVNKDQTIPEAFGQKVVKDFSKAYGVAYLTEEGLYAGSDKAQLEYGAFEGHQKDFISSTRIYQFVEVAGEEKDENLQPFPLITIGDQHVCIVCTSGEFDVENDGQLGSAALWVDSYLKDRVNEYWEFSQQDVEKLYARMQGKAFAQEMNAACKPFKASLAFMFSTGEVLLVSHSEDKVQAPWGFASSSLGLKEGLLPAPAVVADKPKIGGIKKGLVKSSVPEVQPEKKIPPPPTPSVPAGAPAVKPEEPGEQKTSKVGETTIIHKGVTASDLIGKSATAVAEMCWVVPRTTNERKLEEFYRKFNKGIVPENYKNKPPIQFDKAKAQSMGSVQIVVHTPSKGMDRLSDVKIPEKTVDPNVPVVIIPHYDVNETKEIDTLIQNNKHVMEPNDLLKMETKYPTFWKSHGINPDQTIQWPLALRINIAKKSLLQACHAWQNSDYQRKLVQDSLLELMEENEQLKKKIASATVAAEPPPKKIGGIKR